MKKQEKNAEVRYLTDDQRVDLDFSKENLSDDSEIDRPWNLPTSKSDEPGLGPKNIEPLPIKNG